jgi:beta-galactosidase
MHRFAPLELAAFVAMLCATACRAELARPILYLPLDGSTTAALAGGNPVPRLAGEADTILTLVNIERKRFAPGKVGECYDVDEAPLVFNCAGNFRADEGACSFWLNPDFRGDDRALYCGFFGAADWGMLYKYLDQSYLTFGTAKPDRDIYYDCSSQDISSWRPGEWHHVVVCWSREANERRIYVDGRLQARAPFPFSRQVSGGPLFIGAGCTLYPGHVAHGKLDEVAIWDHALDEDAVRDAYQRGMAGQPLWAAVGEAAGTGRASDRLNVVSPTGPPPPAGGSPPPPERTRTREVVPLDGWWHFLPAANPLTQLPPDGWGLARVPGYWTARGDAIGPDGKPTDGQWSGVSLSGFAVGYYQRTFLADPEWKAKNVSLQIDGVDGLAEVFLNGQQLGWLPSWEQEAYDIGPLVRPGEQNTVTLALYTRGGSRIAGIYGSVSLRIMPRAFINDIAVRPSVEKGQVTFSCDIWAAEPAQARIVFGAAGSSGAQGEKQFTHDCRLAGASRGDPALSSQAQRVECTFAWPDAHLWTVDDPFLYRLRASLSIGPDLQDESPDVPFGFREFALHGSDFYLNGKPIHLRGHQIDLGWGDQLPHVEELKPAGMNCFEFSGPIRSGWYSDTPYHAKAFEDILTYADEHGLLALPILPDADVLEDRIFDPDVARLYQRRVDKHVRRYGNHPSIVMWFMHFNLAGYRWYIAPSKIDGSYKPTNPVFKAKERYCLEAQRLAQAVDPRPVYHHACGNFGDIYTLNCYIGPTSPLQERSEWPSRWSEKRPFPLMACEHGLMLIPYWFRPRHFPLSEVYADEPIFDEVTAIYEGRKAYAGITPELFDLYDVGREPRGDRTRTIIQHHPGYQQVKSLFAKESLRSWRTYGVSGIIFNAINWDFKGPGGESLPVMQALARYFGDTDLYIAGPEGNWPSKDHSFYASEAVRKQIVLLNDLGRDIPCTLEWRLEAGTGAVLALHRLDAVARAGTPTFYPIEVRAPSVKERTGFRLTVNAVSQPGEHFKPEAFAFEVFPKASPIAAKGAILVYDTVGKTKDMLGKAGVTWQPLDEASDPTKAALIIVGRESYDDAFIALATKIHLEQAVAQGANLLVFEQSGGEPCGLRLEERSTRNVFVAEPGHPFLKGLGAEDFVNLRGESDLIEAYPDAPPGTEDQWPKRFYKWGNRGVVATFVYIKPHYAPFLPVLESGFDLANSPLMEARMGAGRVVLCQLDVTSRYGSDPVATTMVHNLLGELSAGGGEANRVCACVGQSAKAFLAPFGVECGDLDPRNSTLVAVGTDSLDQTQTDALRAAAERGATVLLLPGSSAAGPFGLRLREERLFIGRVEPRPLLAGLSDADLYLKAWTNIQVAAPEGGWDVIAQPGLVAEKTVGRGRVVSCQLDPGALGPSRGRVKALRFWDVLLANLGARRTGSTAFLQPTAPVYEDNEWETMPGYIDW